MVRAFFHVDEFGADGINYLPHFICLSDPIVVWGPTTRMMTSAKGAFVGPRDLLSLIDRPDAPVRIIGRESWLLDKTFRNSHPWDMAKWDDDFDGVVKKIAIEDATKTLRNRRVIIAEPEAGFDRAATILSGEGGARVNRKLRTLYQRKLLPAGMLEKADRARNVGASVPKTILRDVLNHSHAVASAQAQAALAPSEHLAVLHGIVPDPLISTESAVEQPGKGYANAADLREAMRVLTKIKPVMSMDELNDFLKSGRRADLQNLMYSPRSTAALEPLLVEKVKQVIVDEPAIKRLFPADRPVEFALSLGDLTLGLLSMYLTGHFEWHLLRFTVEPIIDLLRRHSLVPESTQDEREVRALLYLTFGTKRPSREQIESLLTKLVS